MPADVAQGRHIYPVLFSLYVNDMPTHYRHTELALYADETALVATSHRPSLLISYLETYLSRLEHRLSNWKSAINISKNTAALFAETVRCIQKPRTVQFL
jgi:hypothetical protein